MNAVAFSLSPDVLQHAHGDTTNMKRSSYPTIHVSTPSSPLTTRVNDVPEAIGDKRRNPASSYEERSETRTSLHIRLVSHVREPTKEVLRKVRGVSADSVDAYRQKNVPQSWAQMVAFGRGYPGFALDVMELMGIDIDADRAAYAQYLELQRRIRGS